MRSGLRYVDLRWRSGSKFELPDFKAAAERIVSVNEFSIAGGPDGGHWVRVWIQTYA